MATYSRCLEEDVRRTTSLKVRTPDTLPPPVEPEALVEWRMMLTCGPLRTARRRVDMA